MKYKELRIMGVGKTSDQIIQSLVEIEPVLIALGYKDDELWNKEQINVPGTFILKLYDDGEYCYHSHECIDSSKHIPMFNITEINEIIKYILG